MSSIFLKSHKRRKCNLTKGRWKKRVKWLLLSFLLTSHSFNGYYKGKNLFLTLRANFMNLSHTFKLVLSRISIKIFLKSANFDSSQSSHILETWQDQYFHSSFSFPIRSIITTDPETIAIKTYCLSHEVKSIFPTKIQPSWCLLFFFPLMASKQVFISLIYIIVFSYAWVS